LGIAVGVHVVGGVVRSRRAGGRVSMMTSGLLEHGIDYLKILNSELKTWLEKHEYDSIEQMQGSMSQKNVAHPAAFERANYMKVLNSYSLKTPVR
ncbi:MAG: dihydroorotate dehydrogenase-like protein, partial [Acidobacteriaceae bacterium]